MGATLGGISFETARNAALIVATISVVLAILSAWLLRTIVSKLIAVVLLGAVAAVAWGQRVSLSDCADRVGETLTAGAVDDTTCTFLGRDVTINSPRDA